MIRQLHHRSLWSLWLALLLWLGAPGPARAATPPPNRWLLVVETSRAMDPRVQGVTQAAQNLLHSHLRGRMHSGDTLGVWTYNEDLYSGRFPLQEFTGESQAKVIASTISFLKKQKFEKQSHFEKVLPTLQDVVGDSDRLGVILLTSGEEPLQGTPFDAAVNSFYKLWGAEQTRVRKPFVVVLIAHHGKLVDFSVGASQWPVDVPAFPPEPPPVQPAAPVVVEAPPPPMAPPLIMHGPKRTPPPAAVETAALSNSIANATPAPQTNVPAPAAMPVQATQAQTGLEIVVAKPNAPPAPAQSEPVPAAQAQAIAVAQPSNAPAPAWDHSAGTGTSSNAAAVAATIPDRGESLRSWKFLILVSLITAAAALGLGIVLTRRLRSRHEASLITRSMDRNREKP